jgi:adiponectin receptor
VPCVHFGFYCDVHLKHFYLALITLATSATIYITLSPHASTPAYRRFRTAVFVSLGASAIFPIFHGIHVYGFDSANDLFSLIYLAGGGALYIVGAVLYAERCPERLRPGKFDLFVSSSVVSFLSFNLPR